MPNYTIGWVYNLTDPLATSKAGQLIAIAVVFPALALVFLIARLAIRFRQHQLGVDDAALVSSVVLSVAYSAIAILQTRWGQALDPQFFPPENLYKFSVIQYSGGPVYCLALLGFKLGLLLFYLRVVGFNKVYSRVIYFFVFLVTCNQIIYACLLSFACDPISKQWDASITYGSCIDTVASYYGLGGSSFGFDIIIIALPFPALWRLNLNMRKRIGLAALFAVGFFVSIIQIIRMISIKNLKNYTDSRTIIIWSIIEVNLGCIVACIPTYGVLFNAVTARVRTTSARRSDWTPSSFPSQIKNKFRSRGSQRESPNNTNAYVMPSHTMPASSDKLWTGEQSHQPKTWVTITSPDVTNRSETPFNDRSRTQSFEGRTKSGEYFAQQDEFQGITTTREVTVEVEDMPPTIIEMDEEESMRSSESDLSPKEKTTASPWCM